MLLEEDEHGWKAGLINGVFLPFEVEQILSIPLPIFGRQDKFIWGESTHGDYSIKTAYRLIKRMDPREATARSSDSSK